MHFDVPPSGINLYVFRLRPTYRLTARELRERLWRLQTGLKKFSRRRDLHESGAVIPHRTAGGTRESSFTINRRFLARKILSGATGEGPLPDWKLA